MRATMFKKEMTQRDLSIISFCLFSAWLLSFLFEGQVLYSLIESSKIEGIALVKTATICIFFGLVSSGLFIKNQAAAKKTMIISIVICILGSFIFYFTSSLLWYAGIVFTACFAGFFLSSWGFYFKAYFNSQERFKTAAEILIYSNILMIIINVLTIRMSAYIGLSIAIIALVGTLPFLFRLESNFNGKVYSKISDEKLPQRISVISKPFLFLCIFILVITINSGLMYQVVNPAFAHHELLTAYYWAIPYILALLILRNLSSNINKTYLLYVAIAMIGLSYLLFMWLDRSVMSYLLINTLMLGAFGVCDLFWWSILGSYLDYNDNAAQVLGAGLSMNVLGVLVGSIIGNQLIFLGSSYIMASTIALIIIFVILIIFPILNFQLIKHLKNHEFLTKFEKDTKKEKHTDMLKSTSKDEQNTELLKFKSSPELTGKEIEITNLLLQGYTYRLIAEELFLSENTVKYHIKNIYNKLNIKNKNELIKLFADNKNHSEM